MCQERPGRASGRAKRGCATSEDASRAYVIGGACYASTRRRRSTSRERSATCGSSTSSSAPPGPAASRRSRPGRGRCDRIRRIAAVAKLISPAGRRSAACSGCSCVSGTGAILWRMASKEAGYDVAERNSRRATERGALAQEPARCHTARDRGDRGKRVPPAVGRGRNKAAKAVGRRKRAMSDEQRRAVAERMRNYWASRREAKAQEQEPQE